MTFDPTESNTLGPQLLLEGHKEIDEIERMIPKQKKKKSCRNVCSDRKIIIIIKGFCFPISDNINYYFRSLNIKSSKSCLEKTMYHIKLLL